jgi:6-pyruvoyltetrahydropterin/6-carboxytetrahydropterin synthase
MVVDLAVLRKAIEEVRSKLDHRMLDDVHELGAGTLENLCGFIWNDLNRAMGGVTRVKVSREASGDSCILSEH